MDAASSTNPARTMPLGRRLPALFPARSATPNMVSDKGASVMPASSALYPQTSCR